MTTPPTFWKLTKRLEKRFHKAHPDDCTGSRACWRAAVHASVGTLLHSGAPLYDVYKTLGIPAYTGRWNPPSGVPLLTEKEVRAGCKAQKTLYTDVLMDEFVPEYATNALVTGPDTIQLTSRVFYGVETLRNPVVMAEDVLISGYMLQLVNALLCLDMRIDELVEFGHSAPVGAWLLTPHQETRLMAHGPVAVAEAEGDDVLNDIEPLVHLFRYGVSPKSPVTADSTDTD